MTTYIYISVINLGGSQSSLIRAEGFPRAESF